jgi:hypothetical protein
MGLSFLQAMIPIVAFLWSMWLCFQSRSPLGKLEAMTSRDALEIIGRNPSILSCWMIARQHCVLIASRIVNEFKARMVEYSMRTIVVATGITVVIVSGNHLCQAPGESPAPPTKPEVTSSAN